MVFGEQGWLGWNLWSSRWNSWWSLARDLVFCLALGGEGWSGPRGWELVVARGGTRGGTPFSSEARVLLGAGRRRLARAARLVWGGREKGRAAGVERPREEICSGARARNLGSCGVGRRFAVAGSGGHWSLSSRLGHEI